MDGGMEGWRDGGMEGWKDGWMEDDDHNTRNAKSYRSHASNIIQFTILYRGPKTWNSLPIANINAETLICFCSRMPIFLHLSQ